MSSSIALRFSPVTKKQHPSFLSTISSTIIGTTLNVYRHHDHCRFYPSLLSSSKALLPPVSANSRPHPDDGDFRILLSLVFRTRLIREWIRDTCLHILTNFLLKLSRAKGKSSLDEDTLIEAPSINLRILMQ